MSLFLIMRNAQKNTGFFRVIQNKFFLLVLTNHVAQPWCLKKSGAYAPCVIPLLLGSTATFAGQTN